MRRALLSLLCCVVSVALMGVEGCVTTSDVQRVETRQEVMAKELSQQFSQSIAALQKRQDDLEARLSALEETNKELRRRLADSEAKRLEMTQTDARLNDGIERCNRKIRELKNQIAELEKEQQQLKEKLKQATKRKPKVETKVVEEAPPPDLLYKNALNAFRARRYQDAYDGFSRYVSLYPNEALAGNAQFWMGESLFAMGKYKEAILAYDKVPSLYPKNPKVPPALYKEGEAFYRLGDAKTAELLWKKLIRRFPKSPYAKKARVRISQIKKRR
jgi:tol-pal system protein YbgF